MHIYFDIIQRHSIELSEWKKLVNGGEVIRCIDQCLFWDFW